MKKIVERWQVAAVVGLLPSTIWVLADTGAIPIVVLIYLAGFLYFKILHD